MKLALALAGAPVALAAILAWAPAALAALSPAAPAAAAVAAQVPAAPAPPAQAPPGVEQIVIGGATPRFAVPDCVPRGNDDASAAACRTISQVLRSDLRFEGLFEFVPDSLHLGHPRAEPGRAEHGGLEGHQREDPRDHARRGGRRAES